MRSSTLLFSVAVGLCGTALSLKCRQTTWTVGQTVQTQSGAVIGQASTNNSEVSEYLGIPFAQPPLGKLRFAAPVKFTGNGTINGTVYGPSCPVRTPSYVLPDFDAIDRANVTAVAFEVLPLLSTPEPFDEDCLSLNIWTKPQTGEGKKAVLMWLYGGGFSTGSGSVAGYNGANIAGQEDVIVVTFNYRLGMLGFPGNPQSTANVALLDQRLAVEWVRDNIENFGGDPSRITLFGQSAGAASIDIWSYAYKEDPIVAGLIPESGNVIGWGLPRTKESNTAAWYNVSTTLGCGDASSDPTANLKCMRSKKTSEILDAVPNLSGTASVLGFVGPTVDDILVFPDYKTRTPAKVPMLIGSNHYEAGLFRTTFALESLFYSDLFWDTFNLQAFTCPVGIRANLSVAAGVPTWRYRYHGVYPNLNISTEAGAWHTSEVPMLFNTADNSEPATTAQISIGNYMRGAWAAFAKDPQQGLTKYGWPLYNASTDSLVRLGFKNITGPNLINPYRYDADCPFVDVKSVDSSRTLVALPDLGKDVVPIGGGTGTIPMVPIPPVHTGTGSKSDPGMASPAVSGVINGGESLNKGAFYGFIGLSADTFPS